MLTVVFHTTSFIQVCEEARCPNMGECWGGAKGTATATIMVRNGDRREIESEREKCVEVEERDGKRGRDIDSDSDTKERQPEGCKEEDSEKDAGKESCPQGQQGLRVDGQRKPICPDEQE